MRCRPLLLALSLALAGTAQATTLDQAVEKTILRNPDVKTRWYQFRASSEAQRVAEGGFLPRVDLQAGAGQVWQHDEGSSKDNYYNPSATLSLRQLLFDGFATRDQVRRLGYDKQSAYFELLASSDEFALQAVAAYYDVLRYREQADLARRNLATHQDIYKLIEERTQAGVGRRVDLEQAAGRLALAESNLMTEQANLYDVSARYARLVGEEADELTRPASLDTALPQASELLSLAVKQNPSFQASVAAIRAARAGVGVSKSGYYPTLELQASQGYERNQDGVDGDYRTSRVMLMLNYNLFSGGADRARERQSLEQLNASFEVRDKACRDIRQSTAIAWNDVQRLNRQLTYLEQHELSTRKARDAYRQQFDIGQRTLLDVLDTENELFDAARSLVNARIDREIAVARVLAQTHQLLPTLKLAPLQGDINTNEFGGGELTDEQIGCALNLPDSSAQYAEPLPLAPLKQGAPDAVPRSIEPAAVKPVSSAPVAPQSLQQSIDGWAKDWSNKNVQGYLARYGSEFKPEGGLDRASWEAQRGDRLNRPGAITVKLEDMKVLKQSSRAAEVQFTQHYAAAGYSDSVQKQLILQQEKDGWKIVRERVLD
ncbi:TolC family outer membrane protein [Chitinolyticbacter meiyuanensis]|uniref:TolC family outer membrane protein n=1 Tax=Chitinolyticbacter meiyuanensis TaxID=682798 RepID=UPI0011E59B81|nr:TolC family outer membrane protein [Chitinolyticbacter meiyuanensis]